MEEGKVIGKNMRWEGRMRRDEKGGRSRDGV